MPGRQRDATDGIVGNNIRVLRLERGMSQTRLAEKLDVTFQQVQKYENGANRVGAGRLFKIAAVLGVPVKMLFNGADHQQIDEAIQSPMALLTDPHALRLVQAFSAIGHKDLRRCLVELVEFLASRRSEKTSMRMHGRSRQATRACIPRTKHDESQA